MDLKIEINIYAREKTPKNSKESGLKKNKKPQTSKLALSNN